MVCNVIFKRRWLSPLSSCPGPFLASVTGLWYTYINWKGTQDEDLVKLHENYEDVVRVALNEVYSSSEVSYDSSAKLSKSFLYSGSSSCYLRSGLSM